MEQFSREVPGFGEKEETDLRDMRSGGDVDEVILALGVEFVFAGELVERAVNILEIPRIFEIDEGLADLSLW